MKETCKFIKHRTFEVETQIFTLRVRRLTSVEAVACEQTGWRVDAGHGVSRVADLQGQLPRKRQRERE